MPRRHQAPVRQKESPALTAYSEQRTDPRGAFGRFSGQRPRSFGGDAPARWERGGARASGAGRRPRAPPPQGVSTRRARNYGGRPSRPHIPAPRRQEMTTWGGQTPLVACGRDGRTPYLTPRPTVTRLPDYPIKSPDLLHPTLKGQAQAKVAAAGRRLVIVAERDAAPRRVVAPAPSATHVGRPPGVRIGRIRLGR